MVETVTGRTVRSLAVFLSGGMSVRNVAQSVVVVDEVTVVDKAEDKLVQRTLPAPILLRFLSSRRITGRFSFR